MIKVRPRIADLFCGAGGAGMGLHRAGFEVVGFDIAKQPRYPFEFHQMDTFDVDLSKFDAAWASPPCQAFVDFNRGVRANSHTHTDLIGQTRDLLNSFQVPYIIENVEGAPLRNWLMLCGTMFGLKVLRHRWFEVNPLLPLLTHTCNHWGKVSTGDFAAVYGRGGHGPRFRGENDERLRDVKPSNLGPPWREAMGIDWEMTQYEVTQAIPPAYSELLGEQLIRLLV